jgi:putative PIN family toxin of toxin-antitoxin system
VFVLVIAGAIEACVSGNVYAEYEDVITRPRFQLDETTIASTLQTIREKSFWVRPTEAIRVCSDPDDDIFVECAFAAQAQYLVTGNVKHFPAAWMDTKIVTPRSLLDILAGRGAKRI